jgi:hypothetical protein
MTKKLPWLMLMPLVLVACQNVQPLIESLQTPNTSAAFDIASDPSRPLSDRRPMAQMMDGLETSKLKQLLMRRIPSWNNSAGNDIVVLASIGDESNALYFESLYDKVPDTREDPRSMLVALHTGAAIIRNRMGDEAPAIAADGLVSLEQREAAVKHLSPSERTAWQGALVARIPGKWDANTGNDIALLGEYGDAGAAGQLEAIYRKPDFTDTSALATALMDAVSQIRQRASGQM